MKKHQEHVPNQVRVLGPTIPPIARLKGLYRYHMMLSSMDAASLNRLISRLVGDMNPPKDVQYVVDIDPYDMM